MLAALAVNWAFLLLRVTIAIVFGIVALAWPGLRLTGVALLFGAYAVADGALALVVAFGAKGVPGFGSLLFEAFVRLGVGLVALKSPAAVALVMVRIFAAW